MNGDLEFKLFAISQNSHLFDPRRYKTLVKQLNQQTTNPTFLCKPIIFHLKQQKWMAAHRNEAIWNCYHLPLGFINCENTSVDVVASDSRVLTTSISSLSADSARPIQPGISGIWFALFSFTTD